MAQQAAAEHTPIEWWTLEDLLEYLTLAPFRYEIDVALHEMERYISTGELPVIVDHYFDGELQSYEIYPFAFHTKYTLVFDFSTQQVRIVRRGPRGAYQWGFVRGDSGRVTKQDALRVWPPRPPASQSAPRQLEDKTEAAERPSAGQSSHQTVASPLKPKAWLPIEHKRRQQLTDIPIPKDITTYTQQLHNAAVEAVGQRQLTNAPSARRLETLLHDLDLFPKVKRRTEDARKTHD
jgi:hypothetical protein